VLDAPAIQKAFGLKENPSIPKNTKKNHVTTEPWKVTEDKNGYIIAKTIVHAKPSMKRMLLRKASV